MSTPPRRPPPEPPKFLPKEKPSKLKGVLVALGVFAGIVGLFLLVGVGLIWATCSGVIK